MGFKDIFNFREFRIDFDAIFGIFVSSRHTKPHSIIVNYPIRSGK